MAAGVSGVWLCNVTDPSNVSFFGGNLATSFASGVALDGSNVYVAERTTGLRTISWNTAVQSSLIGSSDMTGAPIDLAISGHRAYVAAGSSGLMIFDVHGTGNPVLLGTYLTPLDTRSVAVQGKIACIMDVNGTLRVLDISDPAAPVLLGSLAGVGDALGMVLAGPYLYVAAAFTGLRIVSIANPGSPTLVGTYNQGIGVGDVAMAGTVAYLACGSSGLRLVNVSNPANPVLISTYDTPGSAVGVAVSGHLAFVADGPSGLQILNISNPASPALVGARDTPDFAGDVAVYGTQVFIADGAGGLRAVDVTNPVTPLLIASSSLDTPGQAVGVAHSGMRAFLIDDASGLFAIETHQNLFDLVHADAQSLTFLQSPEPVSKVRITANQVPHVTWTLSTDGGSTFQFAFLLGTWLTLAPGNALRWHAHLNPVLPAITAQRPTAGELLIEWLVAAANIHSITDIGNDQGRQARIQWARSASDFVGASPQVVDYAIYRRIDPGTAPPAAVANALDLERAELLAEGWDYVATVPAEAEDLYSTVVPTLADSTLTDGQHWTAFRVRARTATPGVFYDSSPDSGYSLDNLAPGVPIGLAVGPGPGGGRALSWGDPVDADFRYFNVYRSHDPAFVPGPANRVHSTTSTNWNDTSAESGTLYYKLTAVDFSGNESAPATSQVTVDVTTGPAPERFELHAAAPNPFRGATVLSFDVPASDGRVRLAVYDVGGRAVRKLLDGSRGPGAHQVTWDGRDDLGRSLPAGLYLARMEAPGMTRTIKLLISH